MKAADFDDPRLPEMPRARPPTSTPSAVGVPLIYTAPSSSVGTPTTTASVVGELVSLAEPSAVDAADDAARRVRVPIGSTCLKVVYLWQAQKRGSEGC